MPAQTLLSTLQRPAVVALMSLLSVACTEGSPEIFAPNSEGQCEPAPREIICSQRSLQSASQLVPFKARYAFQTVPGPVEPCGTSGRNRTFVVGEGNGTHLGHFTINLSQCGSAGGAIADGRGTFVAANGDLLHFSYTGQTTRTETLITFISFPTFVGGTGRFEGASGAATTVGSIDLVAGTATADWEGSISISRSNER